MDFKYFDCQCSDFNHTFRFLSMPKDKELYLDVRLNIHLPWYKRIAIGLKYILGIKPGYGPDSAYDCTMIRPEDVPAIKAVLESIE